MDVIAYDEAVGYEMVPSGCEESAALKPFEELKQVIRICAAVLQPDARLNRFQNLLQSIQWYNISLTAWVIIYHDGDRRGVGYMLVE